MAGGSSLASVQSINKKQQPQDFQFYPEIPISRFEKTGVQHFVVLKSRQVLSLIKGKECWFWTFLCPDGKGKCISAGERTLRTDTNQHRPGSECSSAHSCFLRFLAFFLFAFFAFPSTGFVVFCSVEFLRFFNN